MVEHRRHAVKTDTQSGMGQRPHVANGGLGAAKCRYCEGICTDLRCAYVQARGSQSWNRHVIFEHAVVPVDLPMVIRGLPLANN